MFKRSAKCNLRMIVAGAVALAAFGAASAASALTTTVTIKNNTAYTMSFYEQSGQILGTVTPSTPANAPAGGSTTFSVASGYSNIASLHFFYQNTTAGKGCKFNTAYTTGTGYTDSATSSGSSSTTCTATITSYNPTTDDYSITFTLQ